MFEDKELAEELAKKGYQFSSANSINVGRLVPQVVYYVNAYAKLLENEEIEDGEKINVVVPTGNFGNILAAYYAKQSINWYVHRMTIKCYLTSSKQVIMTETVSLSSQHHHLWIS